MKINNNISAVVSNKHLLRNEGHLAIHMEKLSSGYKLNHAGDDPSGMAISNKMRAQIRGLDRASQNASDGMSVLETADGALSEVTAMVQRMRELSVQAANGVNSDSDRVAIQAEVTALTEEVQRISETTEFNTKKLLDGSLDNRVYTEGIQRVAISNEVPSGTYDFDITEMPISAILQTDKSWDAFAEYMRSDEASGEEHYLSINGTEIVLPGGLTGEEYYRLIRSAAELGESKISDYSEFITDSNGDTKVSVNNVIFESIGYGAEASLDIQMSAGLKTFFQLEWDEERNATNENYSYVKTIPGENASMTLDKTGSDFGIQATYTSITKESGGSATRSVDGRRIQITDVGGFKMDFLIDEKKVEEYNNKATTYEKTITVTNEDGTTTTTKKTLSVVEAKRERASLNMEKESIEKEKETLDETKATLTKKIEDIEKEITSLNEKITEENAKKDTLNTEITALQADITALEASKTTLADEITYWTDKVNGWNTLNDELSALQKQYSDLSKEYADPNKTWEEKAQILAQQSTLLTDISDKKSEITQYEKGNFQITYTYTDDNGAQQTITYQGTINTVKKLIESKQQELDGVDDKVAKVEAKIAEKESEITDCDTQIAAYQKMIDDKTEEKEELEDSLALTQAWIDVLAAVDGQPDRETALEAEKTTANSELEQLNKRLSLVESKATRNELQAKYDASTDDAEKQTIATQIAALNTSIAELEADLTGVDTSGDSADTLQPLIDVQNAKLKAIEKEERLIEIDEEVEKINEALKKADAMPVEMEITDVGPMNLQIGANEGQQMRVRIDSIGVEALYLDQVSVLSQRGATRALEELDEILAKVTATLSNIGAYTNRLEHAVASLDQTSENMNQAISRIKDADIAKEMTEYTKYSVLQQAATSALSQANELPQTALQLLQ
ncbi:MAG: hypothetical protein IJ679_04260 [Lachnospiraceae bacterium]|nr:hypothetical protein [Lachnospiraceae bacterium]